LFALPIPRSIIVFAKFAALAVWCLLLAAVALVVTVGLGLIINPPGFSLPVLLKGSGMFAVVTFLNILLITPVAFFASFGKGYLSPLGFIIFTVLFGQLGEIIGIGAYCPWDMPAIYAGVAKDAVSAAGYLLFILLVVFGAAATSLWWRYADQK